MRNYSTEVKSSVIFNFVNCNDEYYSSPDLYQVLHCLFLQFEESDVNASNYATNIIDILHKDSDLGVDGSLQKSLRHCISGSECDAILGCLQAFRKFALQLNDYWSSNNESFVYHNLNCGRSLILSLVYC